MSHGQEGSFIFPVSSVFEGMKVQEHVFFWAETVFACVQFFTVSAPESLMDFKKGRSPIL